MKAIIHIMPRSDILDPQGRAIAQALQEQGFPIKDARQGKRIELLLADTKKKDDALKRCHTMCRDLLVNGVIEDYHIELID